jgi:hypothetical protein
MEIVIGVDPHKATNVVAAINEQGELVGQETFPANRKGLRTLERSKQSASRNAVGLWRAQVASGDPWPRSSWLQASEWSTSRPSSPHV